MNNIFNHVNHPGILSNPTSCRVVCVRMYGNWGRLRNCLCKTCRFSTQSLVWSAFFFFWHALHIHQYDGPIPEGKAQGRSLRSLFWQVCLQAVVSGLLEPSDKEWDSPQRVSRQESIHRKMCVSNCMEYVWSRPYIQATKKKTFEKPQKCKSAEWELRRMLFYINLPKVKEKKKTLFYKMLPILTKILFK